VAREAAPLTALHALIADWLAARSADVTHAAFVLLGVPVVRDGAVFVLPAGVTIEVAQECSGIRSSLVLLAVSLVASHWFLRSAWTKAILILVTVPLAIAKNGMRIVALSLLSVYVDPGFLTGRLHHQGGIVFFSVALVLLVSMLLVLKRFEREGPGILPPGGEALSR
jgi:exosortase